MNSFAWRLAGALTAGLGACTPPADHRSAPVELEPARHAASATASGAAPTADAAPPYRYRGPPPKVAVGGDRAVSSRRGLVVSVEQNATRAGVEVLSQGGNAVDAAVAVGYALAVTHPSAGNVGGGGFMLVRMNGAETVAVDFRERAPAALTHTKFQKMIADGAIGPAAAGVPGTVAGLDLAHERFGRLAREVVMRPSIRLAERGHRIGHREGLTLQWNWAKLRQNAEARRIFGSVGGKPKKAGTRLVRKDLAATLHRVAKDGRLGFYAGPTADRIVRAMKPDGLISAVDLAQYRAAIREPLRSSYRGLRVEVMPPPSAGGVAVTQTLLMLEVLEAYRFAPSSPEALHLFIEASKRAHAERRFGVADPDSLTDQEAAKRMRSWSDPRYLADKAPRIDVNRATPSSAIHPLFSGAIKELKNTTHFAVVDADGNVVTCTTTLSAGFGSKFVVPGTGIVLNNSAAAFGTVGGNVRQPGRRMTSSMSPTLVLRNNQPLLVLGTPGGDTIASTVVQVLRNVVDYQMTIDAAVDAPRVHHGLVPDAVRDERRRPISRATRDALIGLGHTFSKKRIPIGDANSILIVDGTAWGYADPREGGLAMALPP